MRGSSEARILLLLTVARGHRMQEGASEVGRQ
jgi:hypothetical protein